MRRIISLFLALVCIAGLCACSSEHTVLKLKDSSILYYIAEGDYIDSQEDIDLYFEAYSTTDPDVYKNAISWEDRYNLVGMYAAKALAPGVIPDASYFSNENPKGYAIIEASVDIPAGTKLNEYNISLLFKKTYTNDKEIYAASIPYEQMNVILNGVTVHQDILKGTCPSAKHFASSSLDTTAPTVSVDTSVADSDAEKMKQYLNKKYNIDFTHEFTSAGASVFSAEGLPGLVQCLNRDAAQQIHPELAHLYTEPYADNGYVIINNAKVAAYYRDATRVDFGVSRILCYIDIIADPSSVTKDMSYENYLSVINGTSIPECIILTDKTLSRDELDQLERDFSVIGSPVAVRVFTMEANKQDEVGPSDILQLGSGHKDIQYYKALNAD